MTDNQEFRNEIVDQDIQRKAGELFIDSFTSKFTYLKSEHVKELAEKANAILTQADVEGGFPEDEESASEEMTNLYQDFNGTFEGIHEQISEQTGKTFSEKDINAAYDKVNECMEEVVGKVAEYCQAKADEFLSAFVEEIDSDKQTTLH